MTNEKVTLPREVADALERIKSDTTFTRAYNIQIIADNARNTPNSDYGVIWRWITRTEGASYVHDYFSALVNGYNVEQTPHERLRDCYEEYDAMGEYELGARNGIRNTLEILGVKVDGINR